MSTGHVFDFRDRLTGGRFGAGVRVLGDRGTAISDISDEHHCAHPSPPPSPRNYRDPSCHRNSESSHNHPDRASESCVSLIRLLQPCPDLSTATSSHGRPIRIPSPVCDHDRRRLPALSLGCRKTNRHVLQMFGISGGVS